MADNPTSEPAKKANSGRIALIGAIGTCLAAINLATNGPEAPSQGVLILQQGVLILQYVALGLGLIALVGGLIMMAKQPK